MFASRTISGEENLKLIEECGEQREAKVARPHNIKFEYLVPYAEKVIN